VLRVVVGEDEEELGPGMPGESAAYAGVSVANQRSVRREGWGVCIVSW